MDGKRQIALEDLAAISEAAEIVGVTSGRIHQLLSEDPSFPRPIWHLKLGRIWDAREVRAWTSTHRVPVDRAPIKGRNGPTTAPAPSPGGPSLSNQARAEKLASLLGRAA